MSAFKPIPVSRADLQRIYQHVGETGLQAILDDFYERMSRDILIGYFFDGFDLKAIARKQKEFLMRAMGAAEYYSGRPPAQAHLALPPILSGHFDRRLRILEETLRAYGLSEDEVTAWIRFESTFRSGIVRTQ